MSLTSLVASAQAYYADRFLPERCTITRVTGTGLSVTTTTVATSVPYRRASTRPTEWTLEPGLIVGRVQPRARFLVDQDIAVQDTVTDDTDGSVYIC